MKTRTMLLTVMMLAGGLGTCSSEVVPTTTHSPIDAAQVKLYQKAPEKYERLGELTLEVTSTAHWEKTSDATPAFEKLRAQAAARGANGILLIDDSGQPFVKAGALYEGKQYFIPVRSNPTTLAAQAIYVHKE